MNAREEFLKRLIKTVGTDNIITVDVKSFTESLKYLDTFNNGNKDNALAWSNNRLIYKTSSGIFETDIKMQGNFDFVIGFNIKYMLETLSQFKTDKLDIYMPDKNISPIIFSYGSNLALILPVRLKFNPFESEQVA